MAKRYVLMPQTAEDTLAGIRRDQLSPAAAPGRFRRRAPIMESSGTPPQALEWGEITDVQGTSHNALYACRLQRDASITATAQTPFDRYFPPSPVKVDVQERAIGDPCTMAYVSGSWSLVHAFEECLVTECEAAAGFGDLPSTTDTISAEYGGRGFLHHDVISITHSSTVTAGTTSSGGHAFYTFPAGRVIRLVSILAHVTITSATETGKPVTLGIGTAQGAGSGLLTGTEVDIAAATSAGAIPVDTNRTFPYDVASETTGIIDPTAQKTLWLNFTTAVNWVGGTIEFDEIIHLTWIDCGQYDVTL